MGLNLRLTDEQARQLEALAVTKGNSKQRVITDLIRHEWNLQQARQNTARELDDIYSHRADLMRRLRDA